LSFICLHILLKIKVNSTFAQGIHTTFILHSGITFILLRSGTRVLAGITFNIILVSKVFCRMGRISKQQCTVFAGDGGARTGSTKADRAVKEAIAAKME
jgi:hypothetical protein